MRAVILPLLVRIDVRRPASWLACGIAAAAVAGLAATAGGVEAVAAAIACGGWAAAAVGRPPCGSFPGMARLDVAWWAARAAWPLGGCLVAMAGRWFAAGDGVAIGIGCGLGVALTLAVAAKAATGGAASADATSLGLVCSAVAAAAGMGGRSVPESLACAVAAAVVMTAATWAAWRWGRGSAWSADERPRASSFADLAMFRGGLRWALSATAMATSLAGMAVWYFLTPSAAAAGMLAALGWFTTLAVPAAVLGPPGRGAWARLAATAGGADAARRSVGPLDARRWVAAVAVGYAAMLGWPPLVAGLLHTAEAGFDPLAAGVWPWLTVAALVVAAALLVALVRCAAAAGWKPETTLAAAACLAVIALVVALPFLRGLPKGPAETRVEKLARWER